jgi:hypothetical protein
VQLEVPKELISSTQLEELRLERRPSFVPLPPDAGYTKLHDQETGITQCRLSNGIAVNYKVSLCMFLFSWSLHYTDVLMLFNMPLNLDSFRVCNSTKLYIYIYIYIYIYR